jgi:hypothetical protein
MAFAAEGSRLRARMSDLATLFEATLFEASGPERGVRTDPSLHLLRHLISFGFGICCFHI